MPRRPLTTEEQKLWQHVIRNVKPYAVHKGPALEISKTEEAPPKPARKAASAPTPSAPLKKSTPQRAVTVGDTTAIDGKNAKRFKRGEFAVDARLDLHGMTIPQAHAAVDSFIRRQQARGARCVVIVTGHGRGKGGSSDRPIGRIRSEAPTWLNHPQLRPLILAVAEARPQDGGAGALYVMLKRDRAKGSA